MSKYDGSSCGKYFIKDGKIFQCIAYCPYPTLTFKNVITEETEDWANNCLIIQEFKELGVVEELVQIIKSNIEICLQSCKDCQFSYPCHEFSETDKCPNRRQLDINNRALKKSEE